MSYQSPHSGWHHNPYEHAPQSGYGQRPPATYGYGHPPQPPRNSNSGVVIAVIIGVVAIVLAILVFVVPTALISNMTSDLSDDIDAASGGDTELILENELDVEFGTFTRDESFTTVKRGKLPVTFRNEGSERATYHVQIEAVDSAGNRVAEDTAFVKALAPGQSVTQDVFGLAADDEFNKLMRATFNVTEVMKY